MVYIDPDKVKLFGRRVEYPCTIHPQTEMYAMMDHTNNQLLLGPKLDTLGTKDFEERQLYAICRRCYRRFSKYMPTVSSAE